MNNKMKMFFGLFGLYLVVMIVWTLVAPMPEWLDTLNLIIIFIASIIIYFVRESKRA